MLGQEREQCHIPETLEPQKTRIRIFSGQPFQPGTRSTTSGAERMATDPELPVVPMENYLEITEAPSTKLQAPSVKPEDLHAINTKNFIDLAEKDTSRKLQAPSPGSKPQASSRKRQAP